MPRRQLNPLAIIGLVAIGGCSAPRSGPVTPSAEPPRTEQSTPSPKRRGAIAYGPVTQGRYRLDSRDSIAMEMPDGSLQRTVTVKASYLTITLRPRGQDFSTDIMLDSMTLDRPNSMQQPLVDSARGTRWQGIVRKTGRLDSVTASRPSIFGEQVRAMLQRLLPIVPDSGAEAGDQWQDQTTMPYQIMAGFEATENRVSNFRAGKLEDFNGTRILPIQSTMTFTVTGSGSGFGQEIRFEGSGAAEGVHRMNPSGVLVQAQVIDSLRLTLTVPAVGQSVPTTVVTTYSLRALP